jgi:hypothetical protein
VVEVNFAYTTYGIKHRETVCPAMVCVAMLPDAFTKAANMKQKGRVTLSGFFQVVVDDRVLIQ